tara:strand:+ start:192 stop:374 length:183 start_codon:yes stop_codon:yes gene_type:complete
MPGENGIFHILINIGLVIQYLKIRPLRKEQIGSSRLFYHALSGFIIIFRAFEQLPWLSSL